MSVWNRRTRLAAAVATASIIGIAGPALVATSAFADDSPAGTAAASGADDPRSYTQSDVDRAINESLAGEGPDMPRDVFLTTLKAALGLVKGMPADPEAQKDFKTQLDEARKDRLSKAEPAKPADADKPAEPAKPAVADGKGEVPIDDLFPEDPSENDEASLAELFPDDSPATPGEQAPAAADGKPGTPGAEVPVVPPPADKGDSGAVNSSSNSAAADELASTGVSDSLLPLGLTGLGLLAAGGGVIVMQRRRRDPNPSD